MKPVVTGNHSIVQVESAKRISLHHAMRQGGIGIPLWTVEGPEISPPGGLPTVYYANSALANVGIDNKPEE